MKHAERFWAKVDIQSPDACWLWQGSARATGHGQVRVDGKLKSTAAVALELSGKPAPIGAQALHSCDNPPCCNPSHLRWGSSLDNIRDMADRDRAWRMPGERNPASRLASSEVLSIMAARGTPGAREALSRLYGVSKAALDDIWAGKTWNSVTGLPRARRKRRVIDMAKSSS